MLYKWECGYNAMEATKKNCCAKDVGAVDCSTENRWFKKFCFGSKNLNNQTSLGRSKTVNSETAPRQQQFQQIALELYISRSCMPHVIKISQNFYWFVCLMAY